AAPAYLRGVGDITKEMYRQIELVAPTDYSVVLYGESGTGKEVIARTIHELSNRKDKPFVAVDCGTLSKELASSELFGYVKGSFTGAAADKEGNFEIANGGTLFLDEVANLSYDIQASLLRAIQEKKIRRVGGDKEIPTDVRIIVASNENLQTAYLAGRFREDLYHRFNEFSVIIPPLRERKSDLELLTTFFAQKFCNEFNKIFVGIDASMQDEMYKYDWPGNIRELENVLEQSIILNDGKSPLRLKRSLIASSESAANRDIRTLEDVKRVQQDTERDYIISVLQKTNGRIRGANGAAELLNIKPTTLESKIEKLNIKRGDRSY
ncbi:MAG: sigma-54-dependent Fis family transcriptional regulator, partial [Chitinophagaceae bacterium]